jgi:hypothetical protein
MTFAGVWALAAPVTRHPTSSTLPEINLNLFKITSFEKRCE